MRLVLLFALTLMSGVCQARSYSLTIHTEDFFETPIANIRVTISYSDGLVQEGITNEAGDFIFYNLKDKTLDITVYKDDTTTLRRHFYNKKKIDTKEYFQIRSYLNLKEEINQKVDEIILQTIQSFGYYSLSELPDSANCKHGSIQKESTFYGGFSFFLKYIGMYTEYPQESIENEESGKIYIACVINPDGSVSEIQVERGISKLLDQEAKRVVKDMPRWIPSFCNGVPVKTRVRFPIIFTLN